MSKFQTAFCVQKGIIFKWLTDELNEEVYLVPHGCKVVVKKVTAFVGGVYVS
jgi:hypothetical protein